MQTCSPSALQKPTDELNKVNNPNGPEENNDEGTLATLDGGSEPEEERRGTVEQEGDNPSSPAFWNPSAPHSPVSQTYVKSLLPTRKPPPKENVDPMKA